MGLSPLLFIIIIDVLAEEDGIKYAWAILFADYFKLVIVSEMVIIILVLPPVACLSNRALSMPGTADGDAISHCQILSRAGSIHHGADQ